MAFLKSGVLVKFLEDMSYDENGFEGDHKPALVQITSIIPVLENGNLWPNKGFYLKICDVTHAMYVTLPEEENDMVLSNNLKLGQFVYVQKLEKSRPVPILRGITPLPGRRPLEGTPEDIFPGKYMEKFLEPSLMDLFVNKRVISEKKIDRMSLGKLARAVSDSEALMQKKAGLDEGNGRLSLSALIDHADVQKMSLDCSSEKYDSEKMEFDVVGDNFGLIESDSDHSTRSSISSRRTLKRRSWTQSELLSAKEMFDSSNVRPGRSKRSTPEKTRISGSRSANVSPVRSVRYDSSDDNSSSIRQRRASLPAKRPVKTFNKSKVPASARVDENSHPTTFPSLDELKGAETKISWDSLPSSLLKIGKEVVRKRDVALRGAVEAVQEACAAERLIRCLSTFSEFQSNEVDDLKPAIDKFLKLQDDLANTRLIMQSLTDISLLRTSDTNNTSTVKEVLDLAIERKKNAKLWVKSAVASDLLPLSNSTKSTAATETNKSCISCCATKPKAPHIYPKQKKNDEMSLMLAVNKEDQMEWVRGTSHNATNDLAASLQDECQRWFLGCAEKYLDEVEAKASSTRSDRRVIAIMFKIKKINDWLEGIVRKEAHSLEGESKEEGEICERLISKIHGIMLKNAERTVMAI
ncbi:uncharacterized protein LOC141668197 [Apium graveolens]|uniref:uncharacterized protein LOC141668197 n=1 Tax=Apium graveolens TaxID=4045 RepID=UPI003D7B77D6